MHLLTLKQHKLNKSLGFGYLTAGLTLAPATEAGYKSTCPYSGDCACVCLTHSGLYRMPTHIRARAERTRLYFYERKAFYTQLFKELDTFERKAQRQGLRPAVRLNLLSDIEAIAITVAKQKPKLQCYDYTKLPPKFWDTSQPNYYRVYSFSERSRPADINTCISAGINIAVVFDLAKGEPLPATIKLFQHTFQVLDGDRHDLRFKDIRRGSKSRVIGLRFKGARSSMPKAAGTFIQVTAI